MYRADTLEFNTTDLYYLLWGQCTESLQQGLHGNGYFEEKYTSFDTKCLLKKIKVRTQRIKEERHSNPYESVYKLIICIFIFVKPRMNHAEKF